VRQIGRRLTHLSRLTWRRVDAVLARPTSGVHRRRPGLERIAPGVAVSAGEVVLDHGANPSRDPALLIRAAAEAAERDLILSPVTAARLARECPPAPEPWDAETRNVFTRLLAAGPGLLAVWETLDETGALAKVLPEWEPVRLLPHASTVHRFTVDRHLVETCIEASRMIRRVARPDVLMVAAVLHDIGKGGPVDHSVAGAPIAAATARRMGFADEDLALVCGLVRWHLLLSATATTRDLEDPATIEHVSERVGSLEMLDLLAALTEADARATSAKAWTPWRSGLVAGLVRRVRDHLERPGEPKQGRDFDRSEEVDIPATVRDDPTRVDVRLSATADGARVTVISGDRIGLMAAAAGALAVLRVPVRSARAWTQDDFAISVWEVADTGLDDAILRERFDAVLAGRVDPVQRLRPPDRGALEPSVMVRHEVSRGATVLEVRVDDRAGVVHLVCAALASLRLSVRSAHVATLGPQAVDVFYVQEPGGGALADDRSAAAAHAVRRAVRGALGNAVTLDA
jgi:[protein-PII] uridylyltransferase